MAERLDKRLVLNEWLFSRLGYSDTGQGMKQVAKMIRDEPVGWDEQNVFHFRRRLELSLPETRAINNDRLRDYDRNIYDHWQVITKKRCVVEHRDIYPLYFQYLALVFTEYFLDRWSQDRQQDETTLLDEINAFRARFNTRFSGRGASADHVDEYLPEDLTKLAFWIATGGGKTLIMHCNIRQFDYYLRERDLKKRFNKYLLITPNEGLTEQHLEEFALSGIPALRYRKDSGSLLNQAMIEVIEITKLKEKTGVTTVAVDEFGRNNVVFNEYIDEEDVTSAKKVEIIHLPTIENLARTDLKVILPKRDMPDFKREKRPVFERCQRIHATVSADWYGRLDSKTSRCRLHGDDEARLNRTTLKPVNLKFLDYNRLYLDLLHFKKQNAMYNLEISRDSIRDLFEARARLV